MTRRLKTLHIELGMHLYGGGLQAVYLCSGLAERGHEVVLVCPSGSGVEREARSRGINVWPIKVIGDLDPTLMPRIYSAIRKNRPDVVHLHSRRGADLFGGLAARLAGVSVIILSRRVDDRVRLDPVGRLKHVVLPHKVVAISEGIRRVLLQAGVPKSKVEMVHSGVVPSEFQYERDRTWFRAEFGFGENVPVIGTIAQLIERKGHRYLFEAVPSILSRFPEAKFLLLGEGAARAGLEQAASDAGISGSVFFAGFRKDISRIIPNLDIVVHPALREGLGVSLLQAASSSVPMVGTNAGGIPEIVRNRETGILVEPGDSSAIAAACIRLLEDPDLSRRLGQNARQLVETDFSMEQMVEGNLRVYQETMTKVAPAWQQEVA